MATFGGGWPTALACRILNEAPRLNSGALGGLRSLTSNPTMDCREAIERYYRAFRERDLESLRTLLTPDFHFVSAYGEYRERDAMLEDIWPAVGQAWATDLRVFGDGPEFVVLYQHQNAPGVERPPMRMAEYVRFEGDRIAAIEVFVGRPLAGALEG